MTETTGYRLDMLGIRSIQDMERLNGSRLAIRPAEE